MRGVTRYVACAAAAAAMLASTDWRIIVGGAVVLAVAGGAVVLRRAGRRLDALLDDGARHRLDPDPETSDGGEKDDRGPMLRRLVVVVVLAVLPLALAGQPSSSVGERALAPSVAAYMSAAGCVGGVAATMPGVEAGYCTLGGGQCVVATFDDQGLANLWVSQMGGQFAGRRVLGGRWAGLCGTGEGARLLAARLGGSVS